MKRVRIPPAIAAQVLFSSDRTCCVCRTPGKRFQIHHLDDNNSNNNLGNLAVLCFDCHDLTQISGGFGRRLDADQVVLYRDDWIRKVVETRSKRIKEEVDTRHDNVGLKLATSLAEIYRSKGLYEELAIHYDILGNIELRDKYIEEALKQERSPSTVIFLRTMQGKQELIPKSMIAGEERRMIKAKNWHQLARLYRDLGNPAKAIRYYTMGIQKSLENRNHFTAAFYLKEANNSRLTDELFKLALEEATRKHELWWQTRCLQELGWNTELNALLIKNKVRILKSKDPFLKILLARAAGDSARYLKLRKELAENGSMWSPRLDK